MQYYPAGVPMLCYNDSETNGIDTFIIRRLGTCKSTRLCLSCITQTKHFIYTPDILENVYHVVFAVCYT